jgi:mono/diheme cytochrome c family protein
MARKPEGKKIDQPLRLRLNKENQDMKSARSLKWTIISTAILMAVLAWAGTDLSASSLAAPAVDANALYTAKCQKCHGADGKGVPKYQKSGQKSFADPAWQKSQTDAQITAVITKGKGDYMPAFKGKLTADEIKALVARIRSFKK